MSTLTNLFSAANFKSTIRNYCSQIGWNIAELDDNHTTLLFEMDSGRTQKLYIIRYGEVLEFSVPSLLQSDDEDEIPHQLSTLLLKRNAQMSIGFWAIEEINQKFTFSIMHNAPIELMNVSFFKAVVNSLISECDELEGLMVDE